MKKLFAAMLLLSAATLAHAADGKAASPAPTAPLASPVPPAKAPAGSATKAKPAPAPAPSPDAMNLDNPLTLLASLDECDGLKSNSAPVTALRCGMARGFIRGVVTVYVDFACTGRTVPYSEIEKAVQRYLQRDDKPKENSIVLMLLGVKEAYPCVNPG